MSFTYGFYNSLNGDRKYNAEQMSAVFDSLITDGVIHSQGEIFGVVPGSGLEVLVRSGRAWFNHSWSLNDTTLPLSIAPADVTLPRYDAIVLEINRDPAARRNRLAVITGNPGTAPAKPTLVKGPTLFQHPLAYVSVLPNATTITQSNIQVVVGTSECPFSTGILQSANIDVLFQQWKGEFQEWFANVKAQLTDNVVTNLQYQIDERLKISDKASPSEAKAGTDDTKYMTPEKTALAIEAQVNSIGDIKMAGYNLENEGGGFMAADGRTLSKAAFSELFDKIGYTFGQPIPEAIFADFPTAYAYNNYPQALIKDEATGDTLIAHSTISSQNGLQGIRMMRVTADGTTSEIVLFNSLGAKMFFVKAAGRIYLIAFGYNYSSGSLYSASIWKHMGGDVWTNVWYDHLGNQSRPSREIAGCYTTESRAYVVMLVSPYSSNPATLYRHVLSEDGVLTSELMTGVPQTTPIIVLDNTLYIGGTYNTQHDITTYLGAGASDPITDPIILEVMSLWTPGTFYNYTVSGNLSVRAISPNNKHILFVFELGSAYHLYEDSDGIIKKEIIKIISEATTVNVLRTQTMWTITDDGLIRATYSGPTTTPYWASFATVKDGVIDFTKKQIRLTAIPRTEAMPNIGYNPNLFAIAQQTLFGFGVYEFDEDLFSIPDVVFPHDNPMGFVKVE